MLALEVTPNRLHVFASVKPTTSPADMVKILKGVSARKLLAKYPSEKVIQWDLGQSLARNGDLRCCRGLASTLGFGNWSSCAFHVRGGGHDWCLCQKWHPCQFDQ